MNFFVYCLATVDKPIQTYIGATTEPDRRLAQHNRGRQAGGAKATASRPASWYRICYVSGFPDWPSALSFEWHWKHFTKKIKRTKANALQRRQEALQICLQWAREKKGFDTLEVNYE